jgi:hypothetical protein
LCWCTHLGVQGVHSGRYSTAIPRVGVAWARFTIVGVCTTGDVLLGLGATLLSTLVRLCAAGDGACPCSLG